MEYEDIKSNTREEHEYCNQALRNDSGNASYGAENEYDQLGSRGDSTRKKYAVEKSSTGKLEKEISWKKTILLVVVTSSVLAVIQAVIIFFVLKVVLEQSTECGSPPNVAYSSSRYASTTSGAIAKYSCTGGVKLLGDPFIFCQSNGSWSDLLFSCEKGATLSNNDSTETSVSTETTTTATTESTTSGTTETTTTGTTESTTTGTTESTTTGTTESTTTGTTQSTLSGSTISTPTSFIASTINNSTSSSSTTTATSKFYVLHLISLLFPITFELLTNE